MIIYPSFEILNLILVWWQSSSWIEVPCLDSRQAFVGLAPPATQSGYQLLLNRLFWTVIWPFWCTLLEKTFVLLCLACWARPPSSIGRWSHSLSSFCRTLAWCAIVLLVRAQLLLLDTRSHGSPATFGPLSSVLTPQGPTPQSGPCLHSFLPVLPLPHRSIESLLRRKGGMKLRSLS